MQIDVICIDLGNGILCINGGWLLVPMDLVGNLRSMMQT